MRNLKKSLALVVVLAMVLTLFVGIIPTSAATDYTSAVERMNKFKIMEGMPDGQLHPEGDVTRAQLAKMLVVALGYRSAAAAAYGDTGFKDVTGAHWSAGWVRVATQLGVIKGMGDGTFAPDQKVTLLQAITMIERAMGYELLAKEKGGWPTGYMAVAQDRAITTTEDSQNPVYLDLLDGISEDVTVPASRGLIAKLLDNALQDPFYVFKNYDSDKVAEYWADEDVNFLTKMGFERMSYTKDGEKKYDLIVGKTPYYGTDAGKISLIAPNNRTSFKFADKAVYDGYDLDSFMGKRVNAYWDKDAEKIIDLQADAKATVVAAKDIKELTKDGAKIKVKNTSDVETSYELRDDDSTVNYICNWNFGEEDSDMLAENTVFGNSAQIIEASVALFDGKVDYVYGFRYSSAANAGVGPVKVTATKNSKVKGDAFIKGENPDASGTFYINKDKDNKAKFIEVTRDGAASELTAIAEKDVVYIASEKDIRGTSDNCKDNRVKILAFSTKVKGEFKQATLNTDSKAKKMKIGTTSYDVFVPYSLEGKDYEFGDKVVAYMTKNNKILMLAKDDATTSTYGLIINAGSQSGKYADSATSYVKILKADGTKADYTVDEDTDLEETVATSGADLKGFVAKIELNDDGILTGLTTTGDGVDDTFAVSKDDKTIAGIATATDAVMFSIDEEIEEGKDVKATVIDWSKLSNMDEAALNFLANDDGDLVKAVAFQAGAVTNTTYGIIQDLSKKGTNTWVITLVTKDGVQEFETIADPEVLSATGDTYTLNANRSTFYTGAAVEYKTAGKKISSIAALDSYAVYTGKATPTVADAAVAINEVVLSNKYIKFEKALDTDSVALNELIAPSGKFIRVYMDLDNLVVAYQKNNDHGEDVVAINGDSKAYSKDDLTVQSVGIAYFANVAAEDADPSYKIVAFVIGSGN